MQKLLMVLVTALLLSISAAAYLPRTPVLVEGLSGIKLYEEFLAGLRSGEVTREDISFDSWYAFVSYTSEQITFAPTETGKQALTYRVRQPFVFWYRPDPNYFDGETYFYKHNGSWFRDRNNRFSIYLRQDFMGVPTHILQTYPVVRDEVTTLGDDYFVQVDFAAPDGTELYQLNATLDQYKQFEKITIAVTRPKENDRLDYRHYYTIRYRHVNSRGSISPPADLDPLTIR